MLTKIVGRVVSQDGAVIQSGTVLFQTKKSGIYEQSLRAPGTEIRNILDGMIEDIYLTPGVYTVHVLPDGSLDAPWNFRIALDGTLPEVDLFEQAPIDDIGGYDKTSLISAIADSVNPVLGGYVEDAQAAQTAAKTSETNAGVSATNAGTSAGTALTQANRAKTEADRAQALANGIGVVATMRVDTSVGERVFVSNGAGVERMVKAETGKRRLTLEAGKGGSVDVSRSNNIVTLTASGITQTAAGLIVTLPLGLRPDSPKYLRSYWNFQATLTIAGSLSMTAVGASDYVSISYETRDAWPTTLPGTPA